MGAVPHVEVREHPTFQIARELGIKRSLLQYWQKVYAAASSAATTSKPSESLEDENRRLRRENASLREDRDVLKKRR